MFYRTCNSTHLYKFFIYFVLGYGNEYRFIKRTYPRFLASEQVVYQSQLGITVQYLPSLHRKGFRQGFGKYIGLRETMPYKILLIIRDQLIQYNTYFTFGNR